MRCSSRKCRPRWWSILRKQRRKLRSRTMVPRPSNRLNRLPCLTRQTPGTYGYARGAYGPYGGVAGAFVACRAVAASYGLQAGVQSFGYAMFLMTDKALHYLDKSDGWELGVGPSIVVVDLGKVKSLTHHDPHGRCLRLYLRPEGPQAGLGLQGSKITKLDK
jgi:hypothetical protein